MLLFFLTHLHLNDNSLYFIFTDVTELFYFYFKLIVLVSLQITLWYVFYHIASFLLFALYPTEFKRLDFLFKSATFFWLLSFALTSHILVPASWEFFLTFQLQQGVYFEARISDFFDFYSSVYFSSLVYCQSFTLFFFILTDVQQRSTYVKRYRKLYYYFFFLISTCLTPPDLISQFFTTSMILVAYEVFLFFFMSKFWVNGFN